MKTQFTKILHQFEDCLDSFDTFQKREYSKKVSFCSRGEIKQLKNSYKEKFFAFDEKNDLSFEEKNEKIAIKRKYDFFDSLFDSENFAEDKANLRDTKEDFEVDLYQMVHFLELPLEDSDRFYNAKMRRLKDIFSALDRLVAQME